LIGVVAATGFAQNHGVVATVEAESLLNAAGYRYSRVPAGNAKAVGEYPHFSGIVFDLKYAVSHGAERVGNAPSQGNFPARKSSRIVIDPGNAFTRRTCREHDRRCRDRYNANQLPLCLLQGSSNNSRRLNI